MININWSKWRKNVIDKSKETWNKFTGMGLDNEFKEDTKIQKILSPNYIRLKVKSKNRPTRKSSLNEVKKNLLLGKYHVDTKLKELEYKELREKELREEEKK